VLLGLGGWLVIQGELTLGQLVASELIVMMIVGSFAKVGKYLESFYDLLAGVDKLGKLFDLPVERHDKLFHLQDAKAASLAFNGVTQTVGDAKLHGGLSFELTPGQSLAVIGSAGIGKSALLDLITGVRHPSSGHVTLDSIDLRELRPDSLREHVSLARHIEIFHGTIEENVHLNRPQINASDVREALAAVGLLDEIMKLPEGLSTTVQTYGAPLSESQAIRLMIARAIVGRPRLLLIDGALDRLSDDSLDEILPNICGEKRPWTLIVATGQTRIAESMELILDLDTNTQQRNQQLVT
jgi:ABC-type bacteriocin/lantibiotic exporter with double-glycine peptidase domain